MSDQGGTNAAGWQPDPHGRHEYRYWDGSAWTDQVSNGGVVSTDPPGDGPTEVNAAAAGSETVSQPVASPPTTADPAGPPATAPPYVPPTDKPKSKVPVGILALVGLAVAAVVAALVILLGGGDDDGGGTGDFAGTISDDEPLVVRTVEMQAGEAVRVVVRPSDDLDAAITFAVEPELATTAGFSVFGDETGSIDEEDLVSAFESSYGDLFSDSVDSDLSGDLSEALDDGEDFGDFQDRLSEDLPALAEAGVPFGTENFGEEGDTEGLIFLAPFDGAYSFIVSGRDSEGDFEGRVETNAPVDGFDEFDADEPLEFEDYFEAFADQSDFVCDEEFFGDDPEDVSELAGTVCDEDALEDLLSGDTSDDLTSDFSDDFTSDFSDDFTSDFSDDFSSDFSDDFSSDFSDDVLGEPVDPSTFITEYGTDPGFDRLADSCFGGDLADCDELYRTTPIDDDSSYEGYGATCGGRLGEERPGQCETLG